MGIAPTGRDAADVRKFALLPALLLQLSVGLALPATAATVSVTPDGETYIVAGSVIHHEIYDGDRREAATCSNCYWRILPVCLSWADDAHADCPWLINLCPVDLQVAEVYRADATSLPPGESELWQFTGYTCVGAAGPLTPADVERALTGSWHAAVPPLSFELSPPKQTLVNLPTTVTFTSAAYLEVTREVLDGIPVTLRANAVRSIICESTGCERTDARTVRFRLPGPGSVRLHSTWYATYDALGITDLPVAGTVHQQLQVNWRVWSLHRKLVSGR